MIRGGTGRNVVILTAITALAAVSCGGGEAAAPGGTTGAEEGPRLEEQWAGTVEGTDSYISVFTLTDGQTGAYLADGDQVAVLALGSLEGGELSLEAEDGTTVTGTANGEVIGTVELEGTEYDFAAETATGDAGWYRARTEAEGETITAGYILLPDGTQRGAARRGDEVLAAPELDPDDPVIEVPGVGPLTLLPVAEFVIQEGGLA
jgi:hypothetical protein